MTTSNMQLDTTSNVNAGTDDLTLSRPKLFTRFLVYFLSLSLAFQPLSPVFAAVLPDLVIQDDLDSHPQFQLATESLASSYQYQGVPYLESGAQAASTAVLQAQNLERFYQTLANQRHPALGAPIYVPIPVGNTTIIIPTLPRYAYVGTPLVQSRYVRAQIQAILGRQLIDADQPGYATEAAQLNTLYNNAFAYLQSNPAKRFGDRLELDQDGSGLAQDLIWPELRTIHGKSVLVPIVYLSAPTMALQKVNSHVAEFHNTVALNALTLDQVNIRLGRDSFLSVANDLLNNGGTLASSGDLQLQVGGTLTNLSGLIQAQNDLQISAGNLINKTVLYRYDLGQQQGTRFGEIADLQSTNGNVLLRSYGDIEFYGAQSSAAGSLTLAANGSIYLGSQALYSGEQGSYGSGTYQRNEVEFLRSKLTATDTIQLLANSQIVIEAAELVSDQGHIDLMAGLGITIEDDLAATQYQAKGKFGKRSLEESLYQTIAIRALLDAGKGVRLHTDLGDITLKATDIRSEDGLNITADNGGVNLLMTTETDQYSFSSVKKGLFTVKSIQRGHNIETGVANTIVGGIAVEALNGVRVEYLGDPTLTLDEQVAKLAQMPGMEWMQDVRAQTPNADWQAISLQYETWNKSKTSMSPALAAVIAIAVAYFAGPLAGNVGSNLFLTTAYVGAHPIIAATVTAGFATFLSQAAVALGNGIADGNISDAMEELASSDTLRSIAISMVTAGALAKVDAKFFTADNHAIDVANQAGENIAALGGTPAQVNAAIMTALKDPASLSFTNQAIRAVTQATVQAGVSTAIVGGKFDNQFMQALAQQATSMLGEHMAKKIGAAFDHTDPTAADTAMDTAMKYILHAGTGCILGAAHSETLRDTETNSACAAGAAGAVIGEYVGTQYRDSEKVQKAQDELKAFLVGEQDYAATLAAEGYSQAEIYALLQLDQSHYMGRLTDLTKEGVNLARLSAALGAFVAGADAAGVNIAADTGQNAAENNALREAAILLTIAVAVLHASDIVMTSMDLVEICEAYQRGDTEEGNRLLAIFAGVTAVGLLIPGDRPLAAVVEFAAAHGKKLGRFKQEIMDYVEWRIGKTGSGVNIDYPNTFKSPEHLSELSANGIKFTPENVIATGRTADGKVVFLETGDARAGLRHIVNEHVDQFADIGIPEERIPSVLMNAVTNGRIIGYQGSTTTRPIYEVMVNGQAQGVAITIGNNGFIVGANPVGRLIP